MGQAHVQMATQSADTAVGRRLQLSHWRAARSWFESGSSVLSAAERDGALEGEALAKAQEALQGVVRQRRGYHISATSQARAGTLSARQVISARRQFPSVFARPLPPSRQHERSERQIERAASVERASVAQLQRTDRQVDAEKDAGAADQVVERDILVLVPDVAAFKTGGEIRRHAEKRVVAGQSSVEDPAQQELLIVDQLTLAEPERKARPPRNA